MDKQNVSEGIRVLAIIPARYASTRFPGKPLVEIQGKPMIQHVWERTCQVESLEQVIIATDDERIRQAAEKFGAKVCMTDPAHPSGTDRLWEVASALPQFDWILNVQGDEPFIDPAHLQAALAGIEQYADADIITLITPFEDAVFWQDPNLVKAVLAQNGRALYFSRAPVPYDRDTPETEAPVAPNAPKLAYRHIGLYLYQRSALERFTKLLPSPLEQVEKLEQLRALEAGMSIYAVLVSKAPIGVDTPADLLRILDSIS